VEGYDDDEEYDVDDPTCLTIDNGDEPSQARIGQSFFMYSDDDFALLCYGITGPYAFMPSTGFWHYGCW